MQYLDRLKGVLLGFGVAALAMLWGAPGLADERPQSAVQPAIYWAGDGIQVERAGYLGRYRDYGHYRGHRHHVRRHAYRGHHYKGHHYKKHYRRRHYDDYGYGYRQHRRGHSRRGDFCREDHDHHGHRYRRH
ncbi:MAG: hypothetical protein HKP27_05990 [Myxococcales bacterium]|nr:hypothetical protein [Myxococcales bacterium]